MNIFILDNDPVLAAQSHNDIHVRKMIVESGQMLSTAFRVLEGSMDRRPSASGKTLQKYWELSDPELESSLYKAVHVNHPCTIWTRESEAHWDWHVALFNALCDEYTYRFNKTHETDRKLRKIFNNTKPQFANKNWKGFAIAMDQYPHNIVLNDPVQSYRNYYIDQKLSFTTYTKRNPPEWLNSYIST